jgi:hypothetical protein
MRATELAIDALSRTEEHVARVLEGLSDDDLRWQPSPDANPIGWLIWHLTRVQDLQLSALAGVEPAWKADGWHDRFGMGPDDARFGQKPDDVSKFEPPSGETLLAYHRAVFGRSKRWLESIDDAELDRVLPETRWNPPPTVGVRLVSTIDDCAQHAGETSYIRGLRQGYGWLKY